jgi:protein phosphatase
VCSFGSTDRGRVRPANEDHFLIADLGKGVRVRQSSLPQLPSEPGDETAYLLVVADGMGGHQAGERASNLTLRALLAFLRDCPHGFTGLRGPEGEALVRTFHDAIHQAQRTLFADAGRHPGRHGMGTTLTLAYGCGGDLCVAHVGDSRCYLLRGGALRRLTQDHTMTEEMVRHGLLTRAQAAQSPYRHVITNCVGGHEPALRIEANRIEVEAGDLLLLCSDGLTDMVSDERIRAILLAEPDLEEACGRLVAEANAQGGKDNITVVLARLDPVEPGSAENHPAGSDCARRQPMPAGG